MRIAAYDPGESTGWAFADINPAEKTLSNLTFGWGPMVDVARSLFEIMQGPFPFEAVIYESWRLREEKMHEFIGSPILPIQAVGMTRSAVLFTIPKTPLVAQEPAIKKVIDKQMTGLGHAEYLPKRDGAEHARDAVRHLWYYALNKKGIRP